MSVSGIQPRRMEVQVTHWENDRRVVFLYPWQRIHVVIGYGGRKYKTKIPDDSIYGSFVIEFIEGLNEMDIFVLKGIFKTLAGTGKFILDEGLVRAVEMVPLYTTSGSKIGDIVLDVKFSKHNSKEMRASAIEWNVNIVDIEGEKITTKEELHSHNSFVGKEMRASNIEGNVNIVDIEGEKITTKEELNSYDPYLGLLLWTAKTYSVKVKKIAKENIVSNEEILRPASKIKVHNAAGGTSSHPSDNIKVTEKLNALKISEADITSVESSGEFFDELKRNTPKQFSPKDLRKFTSGFADKAGEGGFGTVYKGQFDDGVKIAVKVLEENDLVQKSFKAEVSTMFNTSHRNIVKFYGYCFDHNMKAIVYEYMENGSLDAVLYGNPFKLEWRKFYEISVETAKGLSYLHHECDHQILHHDLKPANILLDKAFSAKITDFGLARLIDKDLTHITWTNCGGTRGYMAPEIFMQSSKITSKCDVYSFGMILFEILQRKRNNDADSVWFPKKVWSKFHNGELEQLFDDCGIGEEEDRARAKILCMVALWCSQFTSESRPSMSEVVMMLERKITIENPPNPHFI